MLQSFKKGKSEEKLIAINPREDAMQTEIYQCESIETSTPELYEAFEAWDRRVQLVKELGLSGQQRYMETLEKAKNVPYKLLSHEEARIWREYLPCAYVEDAALASDLNRRGAMNRLTNYDFDLIPLSVLETWQHCRQMGYFSCYEIWTVEDRSDPVLVGRLESLTFLIARWGESLKPFEEIKQTVGRRGIRLRRRMGLDE